MTDAKHAIGAGFFVGYYLLVGLLMFVEVPANNAEMVNGAMLVLGPAIGVIIGALYRNSRADNDNALAMRELVAKVVEPPRLPAPPTLITVSAEAADAGELPEGERL